MFKQFYALPLLMVIAFAGTIVSANAADNTAPKRHSRHRSVKHATPKKQEAPVKQEAPQKHEAPVKQEAPQKHGAPQKHEAPVKQEAPQKHEQPAQVPTTQQDPEGPAHAAPEKSDVSLAGLPAPLWGATAERREWTITVRDVVAARLNDFEQAKDKDQYCPGYDSATKAQRVNCWVMLVSAVSRFESNFSPVDSFPESDGNISIGLLAMSPPQCPNAHTQKALSSAVPNLICGVNYMAKLIAQDHYIDGPATARGAGRNWSTLRAPYKVFDRKRHRYLNLGFKLKIVAMLKDYKGSTPAHAAAAHVDEHAEEPVGAAGSRPNSIEDLLARDEAETIMIDRDGSEKDLQVNVDRDFYEPR